MNWYSFRRALLVFSIIVLLGAMLSSCKSCRKEKAALPDAPPADTALTFTGPQQGWPPKPAGATNVVTEVWTDIGALTDSTITPLVAAVVQNQQVKAALGARFAFLSASLIEEKRNDVAVGDKILLTFFSYTANTAVEVTTLKNEVQSVEAKKYQPPVSNDEVRIATRIALGNRLLADSTRGLLAEGILSGRREDSQAQSHRVVYVVFSRDTSDDILYYAYVDLNDQKVLASGKAPAGTNDESFKKTYLRRDKSGKQQ
jgi:hypothetical protein